MSDASALKRNKKSSWSSWRTTTGRGAASRTVDKSVSGKPESRNSLRFLPPKPSHAPLSRPLPCATRSFLLPSSFLTHSDYFRDPIFSFQSTHKLALDWIPSILTSLISDFHADLAFFVIHSHPPANSASLVATNGAIQVWPATVTSLHLCRLP